jgi:hypothetical protein
MKFGRKYYNKGGISPKPGQLGYPGWLAPYKQPKNTIFFL